MFYELVFSHEAVLKIDIVYHFVVPTVDPTVDPTLTDPYWIIIKSRRLFDFQLFHSKFAMFRVLSCRFLLAIVATFAIARTVIVIYYKVS